MRCIAGNHRLGFREVQRNFLGLAQHERKRTSNIVLHAFCRRPLSSSSLSFFSGYQVHCDGSMKSHFHFDHKLWWKENGDIVRHLLEGDNGSVDCRLFDDVNPSSSPILLKNRFEVYASDAIYQDLFIDTPPCRDTLKFSFELINRYWEIKVTEWGPPILMTTIPNHNKKNDGKNNETIAEDYHMSNDYANNMDTEAIPGTTTIGDALFLRVPYAVAQQPRFFFLSSTLFKKIPLLSVLRQKVFEYKYEGWIDLYLRPSLCPVPANSNINDRDYKDSDDYKNNSNWEVYRHDDRIRVFPPKILRRYIRGIDENGGDIIDMLSIIERVPLISNVFQWFRRGHGMLVQTFAKREK